MKQLNIKPRRLYYKISAALTAIILLDISSCKKFVEIDPPVTKIAATTAFSNNSSALSAMTGIYTQMMNSAGKLANGTNGLSITQGQAADELRNYINTASAAQFYLNALSSSSAGVSNNYYWDALYRYIYDTNAVLEGVANSSGLSASVKQQVTGEAKFMRGFFYFYAVNLYGDVPLTLSTDYQANGKLSRTAKDQVYQQIIQDLKDAKNLLSNDYLDAFGAVTTEKTRPNKIAASALLARVYLYHASVGGNNSSDYTNAVTEASLVIANSQYGLNTDLTQVFKANSTEAIWQLNPVKAGYNTDDGFTFILTSAPGSSRFPVALSTYVLNAFEANDQRRVRWIGSKTVGATTYYYPFKYTIGTVNVANPVTEYLMVIRLAELYLIRAEAEANGVAGGIGSALADLNVIRKRAGLPVYSGANDQASVLKAILHERQVELFTEWGHRWFDLIRTANINSVMGSPGNICAGKGGTWDPYKVLFPIPLKELQLNPNLTQNTGY